MPASGNKPSSRDAAVMASWSWCQLMTGLPARVPVVTAIRPAAGPVRIWGPGGSAAARTSMAAANGPPRPKARSVALRLAVKSSAGILAGQIAATASVMSSAKLGWTCATRRRSR